MISTQAILISLAGGILATVLACAGPAIVALRGRAFEAESDSTHAATSLGARAPAIGFALGSLAILAAIILGLLDREGGLIAVGALAIGGSLDDIRRGAANASQNIAGNAAVIIAQGPFLQDPFPVDPFPAAAIIKRLRSVRAIVQVQPLRGSFLDVRGHRLFVIGMPYDDPDPIFRQQLIEGRAGRVAKLLDEHGWAALSAPIARLWHLHLGAFFTMPTPAGAARFRLAATTTNYGWPPGALIINGNEYARLWSTESVTFLLVRFQNGVALSYGLHLVKEAVADSALTVGTTPSAEADIASVTNQGLSDFNQISTLALVAAILAVTATMAGSVWQRRRRLAAMKRKGASRRTLVAAIWWETGVVVLIGALAGAGFGWIGQPIATRYIQLSTGFPEIFSPAIGLGVQTAAIIVALAMSVTALLSVVVVRRSSAT